MGGIYWLTFFLTLIPSIYLFPPFALIVRHPFVRCFANVCNRCNNCKICKKRKNVVRAQPQNPAIPNAFNQQEARFIQYPVYGQHIPFGSILPPINPIHPQYIPNTFVLPPIQPQFILNNATVIPMHLQHSHHLLNTESTNITNNVV
jgi:hypothetical protein